MRRDDETKIYAVFRANPIAIR